MKRTQNPEGGLIQAVAGKRRKKRLKEEEWNFAPCPHPEQTEACYLYEYAWESERIKAEVEAFRAVSI